MTRLEGMDLRDVTGAGPAGVTVTDLAYDSRTVTPGSLFFCVPGERFDGHGFAPEAVRRGAVALVCERPLGLGVPEIVVPDARAAMAPAAARFHGHPTAHLKVVGVTGTNGKTTTTFLVRALLEAGGHRCGLLGTVRSVIGGTTRPVVRTTPEAIDLQRDLRAMVDARDDACAMEVSSHALALGRVDEMHWAGAIFTNLTQDHLDFHTTMEAYYRAKRRLFEAEPGVAVVGVDDRYGARLAREIDGAVTFAIDAPADYRARDVRTALDGSSFVVDTPGGPIPVRSPLPGRFNVSNVLGAFAVAGSLGVPAEAIVAALPTAGRVPGRFEPVDEGQRFAVLVDYAHTPDSLENALRAARGIADGRVICVFGAGGDRDRAKRPLMGAAAARLADVAIVTSDNPRNEDPERILDDVLAGADRSLASEIDRRTAIGLAVEEARAGDVVLIAGKGHEQGQEIAGGRTIPFDDVTVAREALRALGGAPGRASGAVPTAQASRP